MSHGDIIIFFIDAISNKLKLRNNINKEHTHKKIYMALPTSIMTVIFNERFLNLIYQYSITCVLILPLHCTYLT